VTDEAIRTFVAKIGAAVDADTIDSREDTTLHRMPMVVDDRGWQETAEILDRALEELTAAGDSRRRPGESDGIPLATAVAAFEAPPERPSAFDRRGRNERRTTRTMPDVP
jgi:hypothetical protein